jgi:hypothetical protein
MLTASPVSVDQQSRARELRGLTLCRAKLSFVFFVRAVCGLRTFSKDRLAEVEAGAVEPSAVEAKCLRKWNELREQGTLPPELSWAGACGAAEEPA